MKNLGVDKEHGAVTETGPPQITVSLYHGKSTISHNIHCGIKLTETRKQDDPHTHAKIMDTDEDE